MVQGGKPNLSWRYLKGVKMPPPQDLAPASLSTTSAHAGVAAPGAQNCSLTICAKTIHIPAHAHHAMRMYLPGAAHPHCHCTRLEVLSKGLSQTWKLLFGRNRKVIHHTDEGIAKSSAVQTAAAQFLAGAFGGATATYSTHWLDTIKVRMQTFPSIYPSCCECVKATLREGGMPALYQGAVPAVFGHTIKASAVFMSYGICQEAVWQLSCRLGISVATPDDKGHHHLQVWQLASAGAMTGILASFVLCPIELVKCRMQALSGEAGTVTKLGSVHVAKDVFRADGIRGLYRGLSGMWAKEIPGSFVYFGSYEFAKSIAVKHSEGDGTHFSKPTIFLCGMFSGLCFCVTHPIESIKTRVQVTVTSGKQGFFKAMCHILKTEGLQPLCSGLKPNMVRACIYSGVQFVTYEMVKDKLLHNGHNGHHE